MEPGAEPGAPASGGREGPSGARKPRVRTPREMRRCPVCRSRARSGELTIDGRRRRDRRDKLGGEPGERPAGNGSPLLAEAAAAARRLFRRGADPVRPAARSVRLAVRGRRLDGDGGNPVRRDPLLRRTGGIGRLGAARCRAGLRQATRSRSSSPAIAFWPRPGSAAIAARAGSRPSGICSRSKAPRLNHRIHRRMGRANAKPMP